MRSLILIAGVVLGCAGAQAQLQGQATASVASGAPPRSEVRVGATNQVYYSRKYRKVAYSGVAVQATRTRNVLQLINPLAPASYGSASGNTAHDPVTERPEGIKLFSIAFW